MFFFQFLDEDRVASTPRQILIYLKTLFEGTFKIVTNMRKCNKTFTQKIFLKSLLGQTNFPKKNL